MVSAVKVNGKLRPRSVLHAKAPAFVRCRTHAMSQWWHRLGLQARFMLLASLGALGLAALTLAVVGWYEYATLEGNLRNFSDIELRSLNALVESAMEQRVNDPDNVAIKGFNGWFASRNQDFPGTL